jgi:hypothetical protein
MKEDKILASGRRVHRSIQGARGFFYPDLKKSLLVRKECKAQAQSGWQQHKGCAAYVVPTEAFSPKDRYDNGCSRMVVWVPLDNEHA